MAMTEAEGIRLAADLALPLDFVTQAAAILARRRGGKSYLGAVTVEGLWAAGQQVVIVDPKGDWWGLRSSADGQEPGLPILILGGEHGDLPIEPGAGEVVARLVVEERVSVLLDLGRLKRVPTARKEPPELVQFMGAFLDTLYRLKAREEFRTPLMLVVDEADVIAPQQPRYEGQGAVLAAADEIVRRGGQRGIGCLLIGQRAALINKDLLSQIEVLITLRTVAPQDLDAIGDWIRSHGTPEERRGLLGSLPKLPVGTAWVWSPGWPTEEGLFQRIAVARRRTFDSGASPRPGQVQAAPRTLADVDVAALRATMAATIAKVAEDDPAVLRQRIAALEGEVRAALAAARVPSPASPAPPAPPAGAVRVERVEVPVVPTAALALVEDLAQSFRLQVDAAREALTAAATRVGAQLAALQAALAESASTSPAAAPIAPPPAPPAAPTAARPPALLVASAVAEPTVAVVRTQHAENRRRVVVTKVPGPQQRVLNALATFGRFGHWQVARAHVAVWAEQSPTSSSFANNLGALRTAGLIDYPAGGMVALTRVGAEVGVADPAVVSAEAVVAAWIRFLRSGPQERILRRLLREYPGAVERAVLARATEQSHTSSSFANHLGRLRSLGLIDYWPGQLVVATRFFAEPVKV